MKFGQKIYWCRKLNKPKGFQEYDAPVEITLTPNRFSIQPASGYTNLVKFGSNISQYQTIVCQPYEMWFGRFKRGDKFYIDGLCPCDEEERYGENANFVVDDISNQNYVIRITLKAI